jgi:hypothetical protein
MNYTLGLDLGQAAEFSAVCAVERTVAVPRDLSEPDPPPVYTVRHLHRWPLGTPYPEIVEAVKALVATPELDGCRLVVDVTGVGGAVMDLVRRAELGVSIQAVTITGGQAMTKQEGGGYAVPKKDLVAVLQVLLQQRRLVVAKTLPHAALLGAELSAFRVKVTAGGNDTLEAWRERPHDDLVLAVALAVWWAERFSGDGEVFVGPPPLADFCAQFPGVFPDLDAEHRAYRHREERRSPPPGWTGRSFMSPGWVRRG